MSVRQRTQIQVISVEAVWPLAARPVDLGAADGRLDCSDNLLRQLVLQIEDVRRSAVKFARPDMACRCAIDELSVDANSIAGSPHAAFQQIANPQLLGHPANISGGPGRRTTN